MTIYEIMKNLSEDEIKAHIKKKYAIVDRNDELDEESDAQDDQF